MTNSIKNNLDRPNSLVAIIIAILLISIASVQQVIMVQPVSAAMQIVKVLPIKDYFQNQSTETEMEAAPEDITSSSNTSSTQMDNQPNMIIYIPPEDNDDEPADEEPGELEFISRNVIEVICYKGRRTLNTKLIEIQNNSNINFNLNYQITAGSLLTNLASGDADIYLLASNTENIDQQLDPFRDLSGWEPNLIQLEVVSGSASLVSAGPINSNVPVKQSRFVSLVTDCSTNITENATTGSPILSFELAITATEI